MLELVLSIWNEWLIKNLQITYNLGSFKFLKFSEHILIRRTFPRSSNFLVDIEACIFHYCNFTIFLVFCKIISICDKHPIITPWDLSCKQKYSNEVNEIIKPWQVVINEKRLFMTIACIVTPYKKDNKMFDQSPNRLFIACLWK